ncbi:MAG TPA: PTS sugar transporter subunit IIA [candidate division Zixibacteria bacterium]|nr:PTS sugar transporter subunit IIA [candidate division Zixibacteria bacterium]
MAKEARISRIITVENITLQLEAPLAWQDIIAQTAPEEEPDLPDPRDMREQIIAELIDLLLPAEVIQHQGRLYTDLIFRERRAPTGLGHGIAVPHVRSEHVRDIAIGFGRTDYPIDWESPDGEPVDLFFIMVAPTYDDTIYNRLWPKMASILQYEQTRQALREAEKPGEIIAIIKSAEM